MMAISLLPFFEWMESTTLSHTIRNSAALIALLESVHLIGLTLLLGTILMVDLSLLGMGIGSSPAARIAKELRIWTIAGLAIMLFSGPLILSAEAIRCYRTGAFWIKMGLLAIALIFHFAIHNKVASQEPPATRFVAGSVACISLGLWISVALAGKAIAIFQPGEREGLSQLNDGLHYSSIHPDGSAIGRRGQRTRYKRHHRGNFFGSRETLNERRRAHAAKEFLFHFGAADLPRSRHLIDENAYAFRIRWSWQDGIHRHIGTRRGFGKTARNG